MFSFEKKIEFISKNFLSLFKLFIIKYILLLFLWRRYEECRAGHVIDRCIVDCIWFIFKKVRRSSVSVCYREKIEYEKGWMV